MSEQTTAMDIADVADAVAKFVVDTYGKDAESGVVLQGIWLAMQKVGSPQGAADVINYCTPKLR